MSKNPLEFRAKTVKKIKKPKIQWIFLHDQTVIFSPLDFFFLPVIITFCRTPIFSAKRSTGLYRKYCKNPAVGDWGVGRFVPWGLHWILQVPCVRIDKMLTSNHPSATNGDFTDSELQVESHLSFSNYQLHTQPGSPSQSQTQPPSPTQSQTQHPSPSQSQTDQYVPTQILGINEIPEQDEEDGEDLILYEKRNTLRGKLGSSSFGHAYAFMAEQYVKGSTKADGNVLTFRKIKYVDSIHIERNENMVQHTKTLNWAPKDWKNLSNFQRYA